MTGNKEQYNAGCDGNCECNESYSLPEKRSVYRRVKDFFRRGKTRKENEMMFPRALEKLMNRED